MSSQTEQPGAAGGFLSPDGYWWWDGTNWIPAAHRAQPAQPAQPAPPPAIYTTPRRPRRPVPWLRILAGSSAVLGIVATLVASIVPYGTFPDPNGGPTTTSSIFNGGFSGAGWDIIEPVFVILAGVVAATFVFIGINRTVQAISAGVLLTVGLQTATMWAAYFGLAGTDGSAGAGALIGVGGAVVVFVAGMLVLAAMFSVRPAPEAAAAPAPATATTPPIVVAQAPAAEPVPVVEQAPQPASTETPTA